MKFLIHSKEGAGAGLAHKIKEEGGDVLIYYEAKNAKNMLSGMVQSVDSFQRGISQLDKKTDVILFDMVGQGRMADMLRVAGYNVLFGSVFADRMELDRKHGISVAESAGIQIPTYKEFRDADSATNFIQRNPGKWVIKPNMNKPPSFTAVLDGVKQGESHIRWLHNNGLHKDGEAFILQKFIDGIEVSTEMWFQNGEPIYPCNSTIETKKFLAGDLGPSTGCQTSVVFHYPEKEPRIFGQTFKKILLLFKMSKYTGPFDINCIVDRNTQKANFLEFTPRMGYNAIYGLCALLRIPISEFLMELAFGNIGEMPVDKEAFSYTMRVSVPPYPLGIEDEQDFLRDAKLSADRLIEMDDFIGVYPSDMKKVGGSYYTAGADGYIMDIAARGPSIELAEAMALEKFSAIKMMDKQARVEDGARRAVRDYEWLSMNRFIYSGGDKRPDHLMIMPMEVANG